MTTFGPLLTVTGLDRLLCGAALILMDAERQAILQQFAHADPWHVEFYFGTSKH